MNAIVGKRGSGKTTALIKLSSKHQLYILVLNRERQKQLFQQAHDWGYQIPYPITLDDFLVNKLRGSHIREILIDDVDDILKHIFATVKINTVSLTNPDFIHRLTVDPQESDDAVSREAALMCMTGKYIADLEYKPDDIISQHIKRIKALPSVTPKQKTGKWNVLGLDDLSDVDLYKCSECNLKITRKFNYCPNCGAKMENPERRT